MSERTGFDITQLWPDEEEDFPVDTWLRDHGWTVTVEHVDEAAQRYGTQFPEQSMFPARGGQFVTARKPDGTQHSSDRS